MFRCDCGFETKIDLVNPDLRECASCAGLCSEELRDEVEQSLDGLADIAERVGELMETFSFGTSPTALGRAQAATGAMKDRIDHASAWVHTAPGDPEIVLTIMAERGPGLPDFNRARRLAKAAGGYSVPTHPEMIGRFRKRRWQHAFDRALGDLLGLQVARTFASYGTGGAPIGADGQIRLRRRQG